jgi:dephospho-CoA kinase
MPALQENLARPARRRPRDGLLSGMPIVKNRHVIGLTGGIASGKSTVLKMFENMGIPTLSADLVARDCVRPGKPAYRAILRHFGSDVRLSDGFLDRKKLGRIVFKNKKARQTLEKIVHPCVIRGLNAFIRRHSGRMVLDIPLLYEARLEPLVDEVVVVYATQAQQLTRLTTRNGYSRAEALRRLRAQWPLRKKCLRADYVIRNAGSLEQLATAVKIYLQSNVADDQP